MNNSLMPLKDKNIFEKIRDFFQRIFNKQPEFAVENNYNISNNNIEAERSEIQKSNFIDNIKIEQTREDKLKDLQRQIREKRITERDLSAQDKKDLRDMYKSQIEQLKKSIKEKQSIIVKEKYELKRKSHATGSVA